MYLVSLILIFPPSSTQELSQGKGPWHENVWRNFMKYQLQDEFILSYKKNAFFLCVGRFHDTCFTDNVIWKQCLNVLWKQMKDGLCSQMMEDVPQSGMLLSSKWTYFQLDPVHPMVYLCLLCFCWWLSSHPPLIHEQEII